MVSPLKEIFLFLEDYCIVFPILGTLPAFSQFFHLRRCRKNATEWKPLLCFNRAFAVKFLVVMPCSIVVTTELAMQALHAMPVKWLLGILHILHNPESVKICAKVFAFWPQKILTLTFFGSFHTLPWILPCSFEIHLQLVRPCVHTLWCSSHWGQLSRLARLARCCG